jgi:hypothetical protein
MEQNIKTGTPWYKKTWVIVIAVLVVLGIIGKSCGGNSDTNTSSSSTTEEKVAAEPEQQKAWTEVYVFSGSGEKKSPLFDLTGREARLRYKYQTSSPDLGMGMFSVYVVDEGDDIMKTGGIPEVMTTEESEESESSIYKSSGRYYLNVSAMGKWTIIVEEYK